MCLNRLPNFSFLDPNGRLHMATGLTQDFITAIEIQTGRPIAFPLSEVGGWQFLQYAPSGHGDGMASMNRHEGREGEGRSRVSMSAILCP